MNVVIVESAAKAKAINKYLGSKYKVLASYGHVRDLPPKDGSVEPDNDFHMHWDVDGKSQKIMKEIAAAVKGADKLILATDPDREGEAISWHILRILEDRKALKKGLPVERVTFNAVTKQSVLDAFKAPRAIDDPLVESYLARRALDYLVGFTLSPVLWRKLPGARSAGRVQSVALRLVCDREAEIEAFKTQEYWSIEALLATPKGEEFGARLSAIAGKRVDRLDVKDEASAHAIKAAIEGGAFRVTSVEKKAVRRNPAAPFTTSTLQQEASRKLGFSAKQTMNVAQRLYEGVDLGGELGVTGLITYMRTDGVTIIPEAISAIRGLIEDQYSRRYIPPFIREYKTKAKNAQEAHEAIRPTDAGRKPDDVSRYLERDQARLYELIWKRAVASQMASAELEQTTAEIEVPGRDGKPYGLRATGSVVTFDGFMRLYEEGRDDRQAKNGKAEEAADDDGRRLPPLAQGDQLKDRGIEAKQHFTEPPPRFTEATLVKRMEELGIGRPSTYASTLAVLEDRDYVTIDRKRMVPQDKGRLVTAFLESFFKRYVEYDFTADLEEKLDLISDGKLEYKVVLRDFWRDFIGAVESIKDLRVGDVLEALNEILGPHIFPPRGDGGDPRQCPLCGEGRLSLKVSRTSGAFIGCERYPDCRYTRQLSANGNGTDAEASTPDGKLLGYDPEGIPVTLRVGRFGPYVQLGDGSKDEKPKRSSIPAPFDASTITLEQALQLLSLPRNIGDHPESGKPITAGLGRYGPFILHDGTYANLPSAEELFTVGINRAVVLLAEKKAGKAGRFQRTAATVLKELGEHPAEGGSIQVLSGRYGPYVKHGDVNATLPRGKAPEALSVEEAVQLIAERVAKGPSKARGRGGRSSSNKPARETAAPKRAANGAPAKSTKAQTKNGKDKDESRAKGPPAKGKAPRSRKAAS
ncbi:MAG TPA: type I DNA topoisomerase [Hyphomicrobiaceae bacterium]|jgi:DNA topoisomerase-1|nr:type I DNA topoisomerase [Hyphomicrobiaceae bacterium]